MQSIEVMLNNETRPDVLREMALLILKNNELLSLHNKELLAKKDLEEKQKQEWINASIKAQLHKLTIRMFGSGREGLNLKSRARRTDADQLLLHAQSLGGKPNDEENLDLPKEDCVHTSSEEDLFSMAFEKDPSLQKQSCTIVERVIAFEFKDFFALGVVSIFRVLLLILAIGKARIISLFTAIRI